MCVRRLLLLCLSLALLAPRPARAEPPPRPAPSPSVVAPVSLAVRGDVPQAGALTLPELQALGATPISYEIHGKRHSALGVPLGKVLGRFGVVPGPMEKGMAPAEKRPGYKKVVVASAADGFQAVFSVAELTPEMGPTQVYVAWQVDGQPLGPGAGPLRLVVPTDKEPSRSVQRLARLDVVDLRRVVPAQKP